MINGDTLEKKQGYATLHDVDHGTFLRFVQWLYHGHYRAMEPHDERPKTPVSSLTSPPPGQLGDEPDIGIPVRFIPPLDKLKPAEPPWEPFSPIYYSDKKGKKKKTMAMFNTSPNPKETFIQRLYTMRNVSKHDHQPRPNKTANENYTEVFLCHARLYVFADKYDIQPLKVLTFEELHAVLAVFTLYQERTR